MILDETLKVTEQLIDSKITNVAFHIFEGTQTTVCIITLENGFTVTGESACVSPKNFNVEIGQNIAYNNAKEKIWALEGYLLKEQIYLDTFDTEVNNNIVYEYQTLSEKDTKLWEEIQELKQVAGTEYTRSQLKKQRKCIKQYLAILHERMITAGIIVLV